jgi:hypothetical protein
MTDRKTPKKNRRPSVGSRGWLDIQVRSWLQSREVDEAADYARRGRAHVSLSDVELVEQWKAAFRAYVANFRSQKARAAECDLKAELQLRGQEPPLAEVKEDMDKLCNAAVESVREMEKSPDAYKAMNEGIASDLAEFITRRDESKM